LSENRIIGIVGLGHGAGVTHLAVMMGNYLSGACGLKTAVLEWNGQRDFKKMEQECLGRQMGGRPFTVLDVDYYAGADERVLTACINLNYQHIIIDFGGISVENRTEFFRCDRKLVVASLSEWQIEAFWEFLRQEGKAGKRSWTYLTAFGSEETRIEIVRRLKLPIVRIPLSVDAFTVTREMMRWFEELLTARI